MSCAMAEVTALAEKVRRHWIHQGLEVRPVSEGELREMADVSSEGTPDAYDAFLRSVGLPTDQDGAGFRFWSPREVRPTHEVLLDAGCPPTAPSPSVIVADYLQECWWYALWLAGPFRGQVSLVRGRDDGPLPPLGSFGDFLEAYLDDDARLYPRTASSGQ